MTNLIGQSIGRYHILEQIGEGGMAVVYKARDTRLEADVAVKVIRTENILPSALERTLKRFEREAKALARLTHPNIVKVTDYGEHENKPYLVMPYFPGGTLKGKLNGKPMPWQETVRILIPIADALGYAHKHDIIHRDVKPANILITENEQPMLADFGVAKLLEAEETMELTGTGVGIGTPEYMAPEQGSSRTIDHRADIYALGVVFYEMVTGRKPFIADTPLAVLIKRASEPLPRPKQFAPDLPQAVENIIIKSLAKKPEDRYQNMGDFAKALEALASDTKQRSLPAAPKPVASEKKEPVKRPARPRIHLPAKWLTWAVRMGLLGLFILAAILIGRQIPNIFASLSTPIASPTHTLNLTPTPTGTPISTPTPVPLTWKLISTGQDFQRDAVTAFATDKKNPDVIYAAMMNTGMYKTIDSGLTWRPAYSGLSSTQVESLLIDSQNPQILYAGTMGGVFKTEDGGENWHRVGDGTYLLMDMQNNSHLYARDKNGIYETINQGITWNAVYALKKDCPDVISSWAIHPADGNMLFIGSGENCKGVYQSSDGGQDWALIGLEDKPNLNPLVIALDEQENYSIYTYFASPVEAETGIYASHDGGATWSRTYDYRCDILIADSDNPATIFYTGSRLFVMRKKGDSWQQIPGTQSKAYTAVHIDHPNGAERIIAGVTNTAKFKDQDVGIFISTDGGASWIERNGGLGSARSELKIDPKDNTGIYLAAYYKGALDAFYDKSTGSDCTLYSSLDSGKSWSSLRAGDWCGPAFDAANTIYVNEDGKLQKSGNDGETWLWDLSDPKWYSFNPNTFMDTNYSLVFALPSFYKAGSQSISANPYANGLIYDVGDVIYFSTDAGASWQLSEGSEGSWDARLFYTDQSKMVYSIGRYHQTYSTDSGVTWQNCGQDVNASRSDTRLALDLGGSRLYLATPGQGVLVSVDNCRSWQPSNNGLTNLFVNTLAVDPNDPNKIYAGTDGGAYISFDGGVIWGQVNDGLLGAVVIYSIAVDKDGKVYAATPYGIFNLENR